MTTDDKAGDEQLLTTQETAKMLGISEKTLYAWRKEGRITPAPSDTPAKRRQPRYYRLSDVRRLIEDGQRQQGQARQD